MIDRLLEEIVMEDTVTKLLPIIPLEEKFSELELRSFDLLTLKAEYEDVIKLKEISKSAFFKSVAFIEKRDKSLSYLDIANKIATINADVKDAFQFLGFDVKIIDCFVFSGNNINNAVASLKLNSVFPEYCRYVYYKQLAYGLVEAVSRGVPAVTSENQRWSAFVEGEKSRLRERIKDVLTSQILYKDILRRHEIVIL